ncbi:SH3 domain-containing protein [Bacillus sp. REN10]|uniref:SH3 domain-containing protein n=1 Tax=Bacillus sp. REN10 TaxID=2782541 RepID=UPI00193B7613|nr:SH3 domain-containing protein [Bacillus sp. REN10]
MNKMLKIALAIAFVFSIAWPSQPLNTQAATTKNGWVSITSGTLNVRSGPGTTYKTVGSLKNNAPVTVYAQTKNGWSEIRYNKKKAYIMTKYLRMYSYLMDKTKVYIYKTDGKLYKSSYRGKYYEWDKWISHTTKETFIVREDNQGLYLGWPESEYYTEIAYPLKVGRTWDYSYEGQETSKITSINGTVTTPAGTFKNVVTVKSSDGYVSYYAPNVGFIKGTANGKTTSILVSLVKK